MTQKAKQDFNNTSQAIKSLSIRFSQAAHAAQIVDFYRTNAHQHVDQRPAETIERNARNGRTLIIQDQDSRIIAASSAYDYTLNGRAAQGEDAVWTEIGSTRNTLEGFGLYPLIISAQVVHEFLRKPPKKFFFANIYKKNGHVTQLLQERTGWAVFRPTLDFATIAGEADNIDQLDWLQARSVSLPGQAKIIFNASQTGFIENKRTGQKIALDFSDYAPVTKQTTALSAMAQNAFLDILQMTKTFDLGQTPALLKHHTRQAYPACKRD